MAPGVDTPSPVSPEPAGRLQALFEQMDPPLRRWIRPGSTLSRARPEPIGWSAATPQWQRLLGSGLPRGVLVELVGRLSQGRWGLVLELLAGATSAEENAALVDLGDALDPEVAIQAGIQLERLLWIRPRNLGEALATAEAVLHAGFSCVSVDLGIPPIQGGRGTGAQWLRLSRATEHHRAVLVVSTPYPVTGIAARQRVELGAPRMRWTGWLGKLPLLEPLRLELRKPTLQAEPRSRIVAG